MMRLSRNTQFALKSAATFGLLGLALASVIVFSLSKVSDTWTIVLSAGAASFLNYMLGYPTFPDKPPLDPITGIYTSFVYAFFSIILTGWLTVPAGAIAGWLLTRAS